MDYKLKIRWNGGADIFLQGGSDLIHLLKMADKLNGKYKNYGGRPLQENFEAIVENSYGIGMSWNNVEDSERPEYVRQNNE